MQVKQLEKRKGILHMAQAHSEPSHMSKIELFAEKAASYLLGWVFLMLLDAVINKITQNNDLR